MSGSQSLEERIWDLVECIHGSRGRVSLLITGGGSRALTWLLNHPGASRSILEAHVPYHQVALERHLGSSGPHKVAAETARAMALRAFEEAVAVLAKTEPPEGADSTAIGLGCTAALATDRERKGGDRAHVAVRTPQQYNLTAIEFDRSGGRDRLAQEEALSSVIVQQLALGCGCERASGIELPVWVRVEERTLPVQPSLERFLRKGGSRLEIDLEGNEVEAVLSAQDRVLLSGSFNPLHSGHRQLLAAAQRISGREPGLELSVTNVDKAELGYGELIERVVPLRGEFPLAVTRAPTFVEKSRLFPGIWFVIGYDTARRLVEPDYYEGSAEAMVRALEEISAAGCRFLVAGRTEEGRFRTLGDLVLPKGIDPDLLQAVPESEFRNDASSTQIRLSAGSVQGS